jgi:hypothetical protein
MQRASWIVALAGLLLSGASMAVEPGICKSMCDTERSSCKAKAEERASEERDGPIVIEPRQRNELARTAEKTQGEMHAVTANNAAGVQGRRVRLRSACEDTYARCTRGCASEAAPVSPVFVKRPATH